MTWVKVCGITTQEARDAAIEAGADALGFVIAPTSPRRLDVDAIRQLTAGTHIERFIVSVDLEPSELIAIASFTGASGIQNHGRHAHEAAIAGLAAGFSVLRPIPVSDDGSPFDAAFEVEGIPDGAIPLFDSTHRAVHGGTGVAFPWEVVAGVDRPFVLAGGLGVDNVSAAISKVRPWGVDASSRLESAPGRKDPDTIRAFVREAKFA